MVSNNTNAAAMAALRVWVANQPSGTVVMTESDAAFESVARIVPRNPESASIEFRFSNYGTFGLYIGAALRIDELPVSSSYLIEICGAVARGDVDEQYWRSHQQLLRATTRLRLPSGDLVGTEHLGPFGMAGARAHEQRSYKPYG